MENLPNENRKASADSYSEKVWITTGIVAFVVVLLLLLNKTFSVLLLVLAGSLIAFFLEVWVDSYSGKLNGKKDYV